MGKLFKFKKLSWKIAVIIGVIVVGLAGAVAVFMQSRIAAEIEEKADLLLRLQLHEVAAESNAALMEAQHGVESIMIFIESNFDLDEYMSDSYEYFYGDMNAIIGRFLYYVIDTSESIFAAYFAVHPDIAGEQRVDEIFYEDLGHAIEELEPQTYEDYMEVDSPYMQWFYGAFNSGGPHWTPVYEWYDGSQMISYSEPVYLDGKLIGIVGADIEVDYFVDIVGAVTLYDTGFALMRDNSGAFLESNDFISKLGREDKDALAGAAAENRDGVFDVRLGSVPYHGASVLLGNDYELIVMAPDREVNAEVTASLIRFIVIFVVFTVIVLFIANAVGKSISRPLVALNSYMHRAAKTGDFILSDEEFAKLRGYMKVPDETGQTIRDCLAFLRHVKNVSENLETVSKGDLTVEIKALSDDDVLGQSLKHTVDNLHVFMNGIIKSAEQVAAGSSQVADGAQHLASGSTQQAATLQEISESVIDLSERTKRNADRTDSASEMAGTILEFSEKGSKQMEHLIEAVNEINEANRDISRVMKAIDDIAFQTNILALNAAVEAARAGQHGKGFAVVADEVRSLATKSAESAKDTESIISRSVEKAELGAKIAGETSASLNDIVSGISESNNIISDIARSMGEQSNEVDQINGAVAQVAKVVQENSATAEQSAAASQQMSSQSTTLEQLVAQFKLKEGGVKKLGPGK